MADTDFNVENLRIKDLPPLDPAVAEPRRQRRAAPSNKHFSYREHVALLRRARAGAAVWNVYAEITWLDFKNWEKDKRFKFSNHALTELGISHDSKNRALKILERLGILHIENWGIGRKSPMITLIKPKVAT